MLLLQRKKGETNHISWLVNHGKQPIWRSAPPETPRTDWDYARQKGKTNMLTSENPSGRCNKNHLNILEMTFRWSQNEPKWAKCHFAKARSVQHAYIRLAQLSKTLETQGTFLPPSYQERSPQSRWKNVLKHAQTMDSSASILASIFQTCFPCHGGYTMLDFMQSVLWHYDAGSKLRHIYSPWEVVGRHRANGGCNGTTFSVKASVVSTNQGGHGQERRPRADLWQKMNFTKNNKKL